jgi:hypothetical protein
MKRKITLLLLSALLVSGMANAQHGFKSEPIWAYSWGVGMGTMVPQGNLATHFNPGFALDTEVGGYYHDLFLMVNGGFSTSKIAKDIPVGESRWPAGTGSIHAFIGTNLGMNFDVDPTEPTGNITGRMPFTERPSPTTTISHCRVCRAICNTPHPDPTSTRKGSLSTRTSTSTRDV